MYEEIRKLNPPIKRPNFKKEQLKYSDEMKIANKYIKNVQTCRPLKNEN